LITGTRLLAVPSDDGHLQRAELLADLGQYDEAVTELAGALARDPEDAAALGLLVSVHLAAERPEQALDAADRALAVEPGTLALLVRRALALIDLRRFGEAARLADAMLSAAPDSAYAQRSGAAILGEARNGQAALDAAWRAVQLAPDDAEGHLVLSMVAARLEQYDLAERAYREALRLDEGIAAARETVDVARLERRRYASALERIAEVAVAFPAPAKQGAADPVPRPPADPVRQLILWTAGVTFVGALVLACLAGGGAQGRVLAFVVGAIGLVVFFSTGRRVPGGKPLATARTLMETDQRLALGIYAALTGPALILVYALVGSPWPLVLAILAASVAELVVLLRAR